MARGDQTGQSSSHVNYKNHISVLCLNAEEENVISLRYYQQVCMRALHQDWDRAGLNTNLVGMVGLNLTAGKLGIHTLLDRAVIVINPAGVGRNGIRKVQSYHLLFALSIRFFFS